ncbi:MAG: hypothetical protein EG823_02440 [Actinobacteria bacterium]|nr:hypothetical protein [Actinomycetota bacterium]
MIDPFAQEFKPAPSGGWLWLLALILLCVFPSSTVFIPGAVEPGEEIAVWIMLGVMVPLVGFLVVTLLSLPMMRYEVGTEMLHIRCGPFLHYAIPYTEMTEIRRQTLTPSLWSSMRLPGLTLWGVPYVREGTIYMCATRMSRDLLLIRAGKRRYGITPENELAFVHALLSRLPRESSPDPTDGSYYSAAPATP